MLEKNSCNKTTPALGSLFQFPNRARHPGYHLIPQVTGVSGTQTRFVFGMLKQVIGKVWELLEDAASRGDETPGRVLLDVSCMYLLQSEKLSLSFTISSARKVIRNEERQFNIERLCESSTHITILYQSGFV